ICKLRSLARPFIVCEIGSGRTANFWRDSWAPVGPLIEILGPDGPRITGFPLQATVADGRNGDWWFNASRSRNPLISMLKQCLPSVGETFQAESDDRYGWKIGDQATVYKFNTTNTWSYLFPPGPEVTWHKQIWFTSHIPKHAFFTWVNVRHRLATRDRMRHWGLDVPASCVLCSTHEESREHLFFNCMYSSTIWNHFLTLANLQAPNTFDAIVTWMARPSSDPHVTLIQTSMYAIWRERNARLHSSVQRASDTLITEIKDIIRLRRDPLSRST
ncbi:unnamed protein product, partial [Brassica oleracea var. botrytis]